MKSRKCFRQTLALMLSVFLVSGSISVSAFAGETLEAESPAFSVSSEGFDAQETDADESIPVGSVSDSAEDAGQGYSTDSPAGGEENTISDDGMENGEPAADISVPDGEEGWDDIQTGTSEDTISDGENTVSGDADDFSAEDMTDSSSSDADQAKDGSENAADPSAGTAPVSDQASDTASSLIEETGLEEEISAEAMDAIVPVPSKLEFLTSGLVTEGYEGLSERTTASEAATASSVINAQNLAIYLHNNNIKSDASNWAAWRQGGFSWDTESKKWSWTYYNGIMMDAFMMLDSGAYMPYVNAFYNANVAANGLVDSTGSSSNSYRTRELDSIPPTRALFDLLRADENDVPEDLKVKYRAMIDYVYSVMMVFPTINGTGGNFYHKPDSNSWQTYQLALDGLYMAQPFFMELANAIDEGLLISDDFLTYSGSMPSSDQLYSDVCSRMIWIGDNLYNPENHLYNHGWGINTGLNGQYWLRAVGWYAAALADVISMLPEKYAGEREALIDIETRLFDGMLEYQDPETGMWYNVINYDSSLRGSKSSNQLESSGTALLAYAMMKSYVNGFIDDTYGEAGLRAFNGTAINKLETNSLRDIYISSGVETRPEGYLSKDYKPNEAKGVGPFLMAASWANEAARIYNASAEEAKPAFTTSSLILSGQIGVNFFMDLPAIDGVDYSSSYMTFDISGQGTITPRADYSEDNRSRSKAAYYGFTCYVNSIQMADTITAAFHYTQDGQDQTVEKAYSIQDYFNAFDALLQDDPDLFDATTIKLVHSIADYGHYVQPFLSAANGWGYGTDYATLEKYYTDPDDFRIDAVRQAVSGKAISTSIEGTDLEKVSFSLTLDSGTIINVFFKPAEDYSGSLTATVDGTAAPVKKQSDGRYLLQINNISAHQLGKTHEILVSTDGGSAKVEISALSYVAGALDIYTDQDSLLAASALYYYSKAAGDYIAAH